MQLIERLRERRQRNMIEGLADQARHEGRDDVANQIDHALSQPTTALPLVKIVGALLPFITAILSGQPVDFNAVLQAILGLFQQHGIAPAPTTP